ncbi:MAG: GNAT family N-acetyltransferase [Eubacterium sp.]|nr:GNAT family N-acetyltransferase [Eubacterium sp.]
MALSLLTPLDLDKFSHLFSDSILQDLPADEILLGYIEENPIVATGILMAHVEENDMMIDWLYVDEDYRRKGAAREMIEFLIENSEKAEGVYGVSAVFTQEHENMNKMFEDMNFFVSFREGTVGFETTVEDFPMFPVIGEKSGEIMSVKDVPSDELDRFSKIVNDVVFPGIAIPFPFAFSSYIPESSVILENGRIKGVCLMKEGVDGLILSWAYNISKEAANFPALLNYCTKLIKDKYPADTSIGIASLGIKVDEIIETYIPVKNRVEIYFATYPFRID